MSGIGGLDLELMGIPEEEEMLQNYAQAARLEQRIDHVCLFLLLARATVAAGLQISPYSTTCACIQGDWLFYLAFQSMRNTVVLQGVAARSKQGVASSKKAALCVSLDNSLVHSTPHSAPKLCSFIPCLQRTRYAAMLPFITGLTQGFIDELADFLEENHPQAETSAVRSRL